MNRFPPWISKTISFNPRVYETEAVIDRFGAKTVCRLSQCPNMNECFSKGFATFLLLGDICTRACPFCAARGGSPSVLDKEDALRILNIVKELGITHVVLSSVTRDDLLDGGAGKFVEAIEKIRAYNQKVVIEVLVPDFRGLRGPIRRVVKALPDIFGHNIETVPRLYEAVRPGASYKRSLYVLRSAKDFASGLTTKSSILVGFGEEHDEVLDCMMDLKEAGCDTLAIGQYLRPSARNLPVKRFVPPEEFSSYEKQAYEIGFKSVTSGPFVRSSYSRSLAYAP